MQEGGGVTNPGGVLGKGRCSAEGHGLVGNVGRRWMAGLDDLRGRSFPTIMIL